MIDVKVTVSGVEGLQQELDTEEKAIRTALPSALYQVGGEMVGRLQTFLRDVWYKGYTPKQYERRTDDPSLGISIMDITNILYSANSNSLAFEYIPGGTHAIDYGLPLNTGDELIEAIQTGNLVGNPPKRPFWNMFVEDMQSGFIFDALKRSSFPYELVSEADYNADVWFNGDESLLQT